MIYRSQFPLFRLLIPFVAGTVVAFSWSCPHILLLLITCSSFLVFTGLSVFVIGRVLDYPHRWIPGLAINLLFFLFGCLLTLLTSDEKDPQKTPSQQSRTEYAIALINEPCVEKDRTFSTTLKLIATGDGRTWKRNDRTVLAYIAKDSCSGKLRYGHVIVFRAEMRALSGAVNPYQFDYRKFMANRHIHHQVFIPASSWRMIGVTTSHGLRSLSVRIRERVSGIFRSMRLGDDEYAVISALLIGDRNGLDAGLKKEFKSAGVLHILCVSGMHVGLIYVVLSFTLSFLNRKAGLKVLRTIMIITMVWLYALITGLGPSVLRAATMFSFIAAGAALRRMTGIYHTLAASALCLLVLNPGLLRDAGFQLSYAAVIGIVTLQRPLEGLIPVTGWLPRKVWAIATVTLAAQIATLPLSLLYFHQFPVFFIPANIVVLPLATLIIYSTLVCLACSPLAFIMPLLSRVPAFLTHFLIGTVNMIDGLPGAVVHNIYMNTAGCILIYGIIISGWKFLNNGRHMAFFVCLLFILSTGILFLVWNTVKHHQHKVVIYSIPRHAAYDFIDGKDHWFLADSSLINDEGKQAFYVGQGWTMMGLKPALDVPIEISEGQDDHQRGVFYRNRNFIQFRDVRVIIADGTFGHDMTVLPPVHADILIVHNGATIPLPVLAEKFHARQLIIDSSCDLWKMRTYLAPFDKLPVPLHRVTGEGAFIYEWQAGRD
jgi:competence protein ComEC